MKSWSRALGITLIGLLVGCASTNYTAYEGSKVEQGNGGAKKTVDGVDIWTMGTPPRKFKVIGVIDDTRRDGWLVRANETGALAKKAKEVGGHAVIIFDSRSEIVGYWNSGESGTANTTGTIQSYGNTAQYQGSTRYSSSGSTTTPVRNKVTKAVVIQYVND